MLFNSLEYLFFLPLTFLLYWLVCKPLGRSWQNRYIVAASYFFYGCWRWRFLVLIAITTISRYASGLLIEGTARNITAAWDYIARMFTHFSLTLKFRGKFSLLWVSVMLLVEWWTRHRCHGFDFKAISGIMKNSFTRWSLYVVTFLLCLTMTPGSNEFIYFQF